MQVGNFHNFDQENGFNQEAVASSTEQVRQNRSHTRNSYVEDIAMPQRVLIAPTSRIR